VAAEFKCPARGCAGVVCEHIADPITDSATREEATMALHKAGRNDTYQITERPEDPPPMQASGILRTTGEVTFEAIANPPQRRKLQSEWKCPECGVVVCDHARDAMNGYAAEVERLREALMARPTAAEVEDLARALAAEKTVTDLQRETLDAIAAGATTGAGTLESARAAASYLRIRFDMACRQRDEATTLLAEVVNGPSALFEPADYSATVKKARTYLDRHAPPSMTEGK
jgi:hypothetical protein